MIRRVCLNRSDLCSDDLIVSFWVDNNRNLGNRSFCGFDGGLSRNLARAYNFVAVLKCPFALDCVLRHGCLDVFMVVVSLYVSGARETHSQERKSSPRARTEQTTPRRQPELSVRPWGLSGQRGGHHIWSAHPRGKQSQIRVRLGVFF